MATQMNAQPIHEWDIRGDRGAPGFLSSPARRANRRRLQVFLGTLIIALAVSLAFTFLRPAEYRASARIEITPAAASPPSTTAPTSAQEPVKPFLTEVQFLTSRPVLEQAAQRLERLGYRLSEFGPDPVAGIQAHIEATAVPNTNVVELVGRAEHPELLTPLLNGLVEVYRGHLMDAYRSSSSEATAQADAEVKRLEATVAAKRRAVEGFRTRNNIVSLERDENQVLARVRNQSTTLSTANERVATAEGKLSALTDAAAAGKVVVRARDNPTLANLEQRASQAQEELHDLERSFTPEYLAKDPRAIALRARLAELDRQAQEQRRVGQQAAVLEAQEELASAQAAARRIESQMVADRQDVAQFTARFNAYKSQQEELTELETVYRDAVQRRARLEASERARMPTIKVLEAAAPPTAPWRPLYWRDAAISAGGSLLLALLTMGLVELFNRSEPQPAVIVTQSLVPGVTLHGLARPLSLEATREMSLANAAPALLPQGPGLPRELGEQEVVALMEAGDDDSRLSMMLLLSGLTPEEAIALRWSDVDMAKNVIHVNGPSARDVGLSEPLRAILSARSPAGDVVLQAGGHPLTPEAIEAQLLCAAHDARLQRAGEITASCLRHTYIAYLARQGIRFADLQRVVGGLPASVLGAYSTLSPATSPVAREVIDPVFPSVRQPL